MNKSSKISRSLFTVFVISVLISSALVSIPTATGEDVELRGEEFGGVLRIGLIEIPGTINPLVSTDKNTLNIIDLVYDSLYRLDPVTLEPIPWLASGIDIDIENLEVTVTLRDNIYWHDGTPVTVDDVKYTYEIDDYAPDYIDTITTSENDVQFTLSEAHGSFLSSAMMLKLVPNNFNATSPENGCGPFYISTEFNGTSILLTSFEDYFMGRPYLDGIEYKIYPDIEHAGEDLLMLELDLLGWDLLPEDTNRKIMERPAIDIITGLPKIDPKTNQTIMIGQSLTLNGETPGDVIIEKNSGHNLLYIGINNEEEHILNDYYLRKALAHVIDKKSIAEIDIVGNFELTDTVIGLKNIPWANNTIKSVEYGIPQARIALDEGNYFDTDGDGWVELPGEYNSITGTFKSGGSFSIEIIIPPTSYENATLVTTGQAIVVALERIGIKATTLEVSETERDVLIQSDDFDVYLRTFEGTLDPTFIGNVFATYSNPNGNPVNFDYIEEVDDVVVEIDNTTSTGAISITNIENSEQILAYKNEKIWGADVKELSTTTNVISTDPETIVLGVESVTDHFVLRTRNVTLEQYDSSGGSYLQLRNGTTDSQWIVEPNVTYKFINYIYETGVVETGFIIEDIKNDWHHVLGWLIDEEASGIRVIDSSTNEIHIYNDTGEIPEDEYTVNYTTGWIDFDPPQNTNEQLNVTYTYAEDLTMAASNDYAINTTTGNVTIKSALIADKWEIYYTYETYNITDYKNGTLDILNNFDVDCDRLNLTLSSHMFKHYYDMSERQMDIQNMSKYLQQAEGIGLDQIGLIPLFTYKILNAYEKSRYDGWVEIVGGVNNFWSFINLKTKVTSDLSVNLDADLTDGYMVESGSITLEFFIKDNEGNGVTDASLSITVQEGILSDLVDHGDGTYTVVYTAPSTSEAKTVEVGVIATKSGYVIGYDEIAITIKPLEEVLSIDMNLGTDDIITSGGTNNITITVTNGNGDPVEGVVLSLILTPKDIGGGLSIMNATTTSTGIVNAMFTTNDVNIKTTFHITVEAAKEGYVSATDKTTIQVTPDSEAASDSGFAWFALTLVALIGAGVVFFLWFRLGEKPPVADYAYQDEEYQDYPDEEGVEYQDEYYDE